MRNYLRQQWNINHSVRKSTIKEIDHCKTCLFMV
jgi:hypothetical protein